MYAVIETGGKQYRVEVGTELEVELLDAEPGSAITLERVLLVADGDEARVGRPVVPNAAVQATILRRDRGDKVIAFKYRPKARRRVKKGHRQELTVLRVTDVTVDGRSAAAEVRQAEEAAQTERQRLAQAAATQAAADAALAAKLAARDAEPAAAPVATKRARPKKAAVTAIPAEAPAADAPKRTRVRAAKAPEAPEAPAEAAPGEPDASATPKKSRTKKDG